MNIWFLNSTSTRKTLKINQTSHYSMQNELPKWRNYLVMWVQNRTTYEPGIVRTIKSSRAEYKTSLECLGALYSLGCTLLVSLDSHFWFKYINATKFIGVIWIIYWPNLECGEFLQVIEFWHFWFDWGHFRLIKDY